MGFCLRWIAPYPLGGALPGLEEDHSAVDDAVCAIEFVDGVRQTGGDTGMSACENRQSAKKNLGKAQMNADKTRIQKTDCNT